MKRKLFTLIAFAAFAMTTSAQANLFAAEDIDADGWLWFDTQEKIDKYVGKADEDGNKLDPNGKIIQLQYADQYPDYPAPTVSATQQGAGTDGEIGTSGCKTGAIVLNSCSALMSINGGRMLISMPSCTSLSICYSCERSVGVRLSSTNNIDAECVANISETFDNNKYSARAAYDGVMRRLSSYGVQTWSGLESLNNNMLEGTIASTTPVYVMFENGTKSELYIHGIKALTAKTTGINNVNAAESSAVSGVYDMQGKLVSRTADGLSKGLYIVKTGKNAKKVVVK